VAKGVAFRSDIADNLAIADVVKDAKELGPRPYHIVNAHAIMINDENAKIALRGGDNFILSPFFVGSETTGWMRTSVFTKKTGPLTLATAMAVSGAAANANAGYIGTGITRDRFVSAVMSILNIRLGLWIANPKMTVPAEKGERRKLGDPEAKPWVKPRIPNYMRPVLTCGIFGFGQHRNATFLELSDGGHFENLGLYELVRREMDLILVVDAEQDSSISLAALVSSTNRIKEDFEVRVEFLEGGGPEILIGQPKNQYPAGIRIARSPYIVAKLHYPGGKVGVLIYIKSTVIEKLEFATAGYLAANPEFPHQTTADQFFDPDQFEAYRDLGRKSCDYMAEKLALATNFAKPDELFNAYGFSPKRTSTGPGHVQGVL
jgi:hypothetical protein